MSEETKEWYRLPSESSSAYEAFRIYLESSDRSLQNVAEMLQKSRQTINRWANRYDWKARAVAYDSSITEFNRQSKLKMRESETVALRKIANLMISRVTEKLSALDVSKMTPRTTVEMALASKELLKEVYDFENTTDATGGVTEIIIKKFGE